MTQFLFAVYTINFLTMSVGTAGWILVMKTQDVCFTYSYDYLLVISLFPNMVCSIFVYDFLTEVRVSVLGISKMTSHKFKRLQQGCMRHVDDDFSRTKFY